MILISASIAMFMVKLDAYIVNISLPTIAQNFHSTRDVASLVLLAYLVASTSTLLLFGTLGDRLGLRKIFILGFILFTAGSLLCGLSPGISYLIAARFLQGLGGSMLVANCMAIVGRFMPHEKVGSSYGILATIAAVGVSTGAPLGGIITYYASWHWIFLINIPVGIIAIWLARKYIPTETKLPFSFKEFDFSGTILALLAFTCLIVAFNAFDNRGVDAIVPYIILTFAVLFFTLFIWREKHALNPILDLSLFRIKPLVIALIASLLVLTAYFGNGYMMPFYLERDLGLTANWVGMLVMISSVMVMVISPFSGKWSDKTNPLNISLIGMGLGIVTFLYFSYTIGYLNLWFAAGFLFLAGIMAGLFMSPNNKLIMEMASEGKHGIVSATANTVSSLAAVMGVSIYQMIFSVTTGGDKATPTISESAVGFSNAYLAAAIMIFMALALSLFNKRRVKKQVTS
jgi:EmrB/QacA subfamily drug resistance transporter